MSERTGAGGSNTKSVKSPGEPWTGQVRPRNATVLKLARMMERTGSSLEHLTVRIAIPGPTWQSPNRGRRKEARWGEVAAEKADAPVESVSRALAAFLPERAVHVSRQDAGIPAAGVLDCSVGVMAYNEQANIADALGSILGQKLTTGRIAELIVVASGCEDRTAAIVADIARRDPRVRLIEQERREGKASAINLFLGAARSPVLVMVGADVLAEDGAFQALLRHFEDPSVGMVGGRPTPVNGETTFLGHAVHLQWRLHDRIAREAPKLGEIVAFRNLVPSIPLDTAVDEISIQALISQLGYRLLYEPQAVVYNRGPTTVPDFLRQRRRIYAGHLRVREQQDYAAPTMSTWRVVRALWRSRSFATPRAALWSMGTVGLEAIARALGRYDVMRRHPAHVWEMSATTKNYIAEGASAQTQHNVVVFHIVNFHRQQLQIGLHASHQLTRRAADHIKRVLGSAAIVSIQHSGTIIVLLPGDREAVERTAHELMQKFEATPLPVRDHGTTIHVALACGIIAFPQAGPPLVKSIPVTVLEAAPSTSIAG
jgi:poly-beta-1,6-N-acetyl-D-glucosamine synthase